MHLLAIETTGAFASAALLQADEKGAEPVIQGVIHGSDRFSHLQNLTPQLQQLLQESALSIGDIDAVAVSNGPGSFTGIRIGVSTGRALAQITGFPCVGVSSLEALALRAEESGAISCEGAAADDLLICPILDARRSQVYGAGYMLRQGRPVCEVPAGSYLIDEFLELISDRERVVFLGDGIDTCGEKIRKQRGEADIFAEKEHRYQDARTVALRGWQLWQEGKTCDYLTLQPEYLRMAEAERKLRDRQAQNRQAQKK